MTLDSEFLLKVKNHITSKLKSLGAFIDEELPDYIMVMVANKKNEESMAKDLQLFLGSHTEEFTKWLHSTLAELKHAGRTQKSKSRDKEHIHLATKSKPSGRKKVQKSEISHDSRPDYRVSSRSRSRSPVSSCKKNNLSREPHEDTELVNIHADENDFTNDVISSTESVQEKRKIVNTASITRPLAPSRPLEPDMNNEESINMRSVVQIKGGTTTQRKAEKVSTKGIQPVGLLLKRAVDQARSNDEPQKRHKPIISARRTPVNKPIACEDVSSSTMESTKFFVTLSGADSSQMQTKSDFSERRTEYNEDNRNPVMGGIKARLGSRRTAPYQRVASSSSKISAKDRLGPNIQRLSYKHSPSIDFHDEINFDDEQDIVELIEGDLDDTDMCYEEKRTKPEASNRLVQVARTLKNDLATETRVPKSRLVDRLNQRNLVVSLNETDEEEDIANQTVVESQSEITTASSTKPNLNTGTEKQSNIPSSLERCKFWPSCRNGLNCPYIHPSEPCPTFPRCRQGATCTFIHPICRYGAFCNREDCAFSHPSKTAAPKSGMMSVHTNQVVCRFENRCTNAHCPFYHPLPTKRPLAPTATPNAVAASPVPCRYGAACTNKAKCPFAHRDIPPPDKLKWVASARQTVNTAVNEGDQKATTTPVS